MTANISTGSRNRVESVLLEMDTSRCRRCLDKVPCDDCSTRLVVSTVLLLLLLTLLVLLLPLTAASVPPHDTSPGRVAVLSMLRCKQEDATVNLSVGYGCFCRERFRPAVPRDKLDSCCMVAHCCARTALLHSCQSESGLSTLDARLNERPSCKSTLLDPSRSRHLGSEVVEVTGTPAEERASGRACGRALDGCERELHGCARGAKVTPGFVGLLQDDVCRSDIDRPVCSVEPSKDLQPKIRNTRHTITPTSKLTIKSTARPTLGHTTRPTPGPATTSTTAGPLTRSIVTSAVKSLTIPTDKPTRRPVEYFLKRILTLGRKGPASSATRPTTGASTNFTARPTSKSTGPITSTTVRPPLRPIVRSSVKYTTVPTNKHTGRPIDDLFKRILTFGRKGHSSSAASPATRPTTSYIARPSTRSTTRFITTPIARTSTGPTASTTSGLPTRPIVRCAVKSTTIPTDKHTGRPVKISLSVF